MYAVDWLGCGASERPAWTAKTVEEGERFFTESLEAWRLEQGIAGPIIVVGHSLGGYLAAAYSLHHPEAVEHLVLVSPAGETFSLQVVVCSVLCIVSSAYTHSFMPSG